MLKYDLLSETKLYIASLFIFINILFLFIFTLSVKQTYLIYQRIKYAFITVSISWVKRETQTDQY